MAKLTTRTVQTTKSAGMLSDGDGLYLRVGPNGGKSWVLRTVVHGRRRDLGIGSASLVSLAEARERRGNFARWRGAGVILTQCVSGNF